MQGVHEARLHDVSYVFHMTEGSPDCNKYLLFNIYKQADKQALFLLPYYVNNYLSIAMFFLCLTQPLYSLYFTVVSLHFAFFY